MTTDIIADCYEPWVTYNNIAGQFRSFVLIGDHHCLIPHVITIDDICPIDGDSHIPIRWQCNIAIFSKGPAISDTKDLQRACLSISGLLNNINMPAKYLEMSGSSYDLMKHTGCPDILKILSKYLRKLDPLSCTRDILINNAYHSIIRCNKLWIIQMLMYTALGRSKVENFQTARVSGTVPI